MEWTLRTRWPPALLALVFSHALTDLRAPRTLWPYLLLCCPTPGSVTTLGFLTASVLHFCDDAGWKGSAGVHALFALAAARFGLNAAFDVALGYLAFVHVPLHAQRVLARDGGAAAVALAALSALVLAPSAPRGRVRVTHGVQRLILAHVVCECAQQ